MSLEELLNCERDIIAHYKHKKTLFRGKSLFYENTITKKDVQDTIKKHQTSNTYLKQIRKGLAFTLLVFVPVTYEISYQTIQRRNSKSF